MKESIFIWANSFWADEQSFGLNYRIRFELCNKVWLVCLVTAFVSTIQGSFTVMGVVSGPILGVFILGMFFPATNRLVSTLELLLDVWIHFNAFPIKNPSLCVITKPAISVCCVVILSFTLFIKEVHTFVISHNIPLWLGVWFQECHYWKPNKTI